MMARSGHENETAICTIACRNYLARAHVLAQSLREHQPELRLHVFLADRPNGMDREAAGDVLTLRDLAGVRPILERLCFACDQKGFAAAVKPFLLQELMRRGFGQVLFLDPDMVVLDRLDSLLNALCSHEILLCPHRLTPSAGGVLDERTFIQAGTFNAGVVGVGSGPEAERFLSWWCDRVSYRCRHDLAEGCHYDQRWLDLVPGLFGGVGILRDPRMNVAWWNLDERPAPGTCALFHASGYDPRRPRLLSVHAPAVFAAPSHDLTILLNAYQARLTACGDDVIRNTPYGFATLYDGMPIPDVFREIYGDLGESAARFADPFDTERPDSFLAWLRAPAGPCPRRGVVVSNLWLGIWRRRPDVRSAYPEPLGADYAGFVTWAVVSGGDEHAVPEGFRLAALAMPEAGPRWTFRPGSGLLARLRRMRQK